MEKSILFTKSAVDFKFISFAIWVIALFTPLQLFLFNGLSLSGFLANLIAVPLYSFFLVPLILFAVFTNGACFSWQLANKLAEGITWLISVFQGNWFNVSLNFSAGFNRTLCRNFLC